MTEELKYANKQAPRAIVFSVYLGAVTGLIFLIAVCFCIKDIRRVAETATLVPLIQVYFDSTASNLASCILASFIVIIDIACAVALSTQGSRSLYAFARDHGLPYSNIISKVEPRRHVPAAALLLATMIQMAFNSIYFGTVTGFNTVIAIATEGYYLSYAMPLLARLINYFSGSRRNFVGPWALNSAVSVGVNAVGLLYLVFACITFNFPSVYPVTTTNMNYTSAAVGVIMLIAAFTWLTEARKYFSGPEVEEVEGVVDLRRDSCHAEKGSDVEQH
jgi:choline transport protein